MATKQDVRTILNEKIGPIRSKFRSIRDELDDLSITGLSALARSRGVWDRGVIDDRAAWVPSS